MEDFWNTLTPPWQACLEEAWAAYCTGNLPIGAVITDADGIILSRGRNRWYDTQIEPNQIGGSRLAHAELNALLKLPQNRADYRSWSLYTTLEPCPLCIGAMYMVGLRNLHYAARDPWAGSTNLLGTTDYMSRKTILIGKPQRTDMEAILIGMGTEAILQDRITRTREVLETKRAYCPAGVQFGETLFSKKVLPKLKTRASAAPQVYNYLAKLWYKYEQL